MKRASRLAALCLLLPALLSASTATPDPPAPGRVVEGRERTLFRLEHPRSLPPIPDHAAGSWRQRVVRRDARTAVVEVETRIAPLASRAPWPIEEPAVGAGPHLASPPGAGGLVRVARRALGDEPPGDVYTASARILARIAERIEIDDDIGPATSGDPATVWNRGRASCIGRANLAVALLRAVGIPARTAHGIRLPAGAGSRAVVSPALLHRWIEVRLPDRGWVPSDPDVSHHFIDSSYLLLDLGGAEPAEVDQALRGLVVRVVDRQGDLVASDLADPMTGHGAGAPPLAPNTAERRAAAILVRAPAGSRVVLQGAGTTRTALIDASGRHSFLGLEPGIYRLRGRSGSTMKLLVSRDELVRVRLR